MVEERSGVVTFQGGPITLVGPEIVVGTALPAGQLTGSDMRPVAIGEAGRGKTKLVITVPSVDTPVCSIESKKFSDAVRALDPEKVAVYIVSADLPFAQKRWSDAEGVDNLTLLSDYRSMDTARNWGLYVKEMGLFARAVYVADPTGKVTYSEIVPDIASEPDYDAALAAVKSAS